MIRLTENAIEYLNSIKKDDYVTLGVQGGGCSGFTYVWDYMKNWLMLSGVNHTKIV